MIKRTEEEMEQLMKDWEAEQQAKAERDEELESRIANPCAKCLHNTICGKQEDIQAWREGQKEAARKDRKATFTRTCGDRLTVSVPQLFDLKGEQDATDKSGETATVGVQEHLQV